MNETKPTSMNEAAPITNTEIDQMFQRLLGNSTSLMRSAALQQLLYPSRNVNYECRYPDVIAIADYKKMYHREGLAKRVVSIFPQYCWQQMPTITENEDSKETPWEADLKALIKNCKVAHYLHRIDVMSGIGQYGVLVMGLNDGQKLDQPVNGINEKTGEAVSQLSLQLMYLKPFDQEAVEIKIRETDISSPRYGHPVMYAIKFEDITSTTPEGETGSKVVMVHYTRVLHVADNREHSEILGIPRMKDVYNRLIDITQKLLPGSAEMFWKGGYPGFAFENPPGTEVVLDNDAIRDTMQAYTDGLQRYLAMQNLNVKQLSPQIADPVGHLNAQIEAIAMSLGIPKRILTGSEQAKLASTQDKNNWNDQVIARRQSYVEPMIIRPFIDRMMAYGVIPFVEEYFVEWPDIDSPDEESKARVAQIKTDTLSKYVNGDVVMIMQPEDFLVKITGMEPDEAKQVVESTAKYVADNKLDEEPEDDDLDNKPEDDKKKKDDKET